MSPDDGCPSQVSVAASYPVAHGCKKSGAFYMPDGTLIAAVYLHDDMTIKKIQIMEWRLKDFANAPTMCDSDHSINQTNTCDLWRNKSKAKKILS